MIRLGITGGIGSGKSYVAHLLTERFSIPVYDCDREAKRLNEESPVIREGLTKLVGKEAYHEDGSLNKTAVAQWLFADKANATRINALIHPVVRLDWQEWSMAHADDLVALESAILYESGFDSEVDKVLFVDAPLEMRIQRAMKRDGSTREQIVSRIAHQQTELARSKADYVVLNDGTDLEPQLKDILIRIKSTNNKR